MGIFNTVIGWLGGTQPTIAFTILSGVVAFIAKMAYDLHQERRKDRLERINQQLKFLYGPLYSINQASASAWTSFRTRYRPGKSFFGTELPPTPEELEAWKLWTTTVFQPYNEAMCSIVEKNIDLLIEDNLPEELVTLVAHVAAFKTVILRWEKNDFSDYLPILNYPHPQLGKYLEKSFLALKEMQRGLIG